MPTGDHNYLGCVDDPHHDFDVASEGVIQDGRFDAELNVERLSSNAMAMMAGSLLAGRRRGGLSWGPGPARWAARS